MYVPQKDIRVAGGELGAIDRRTPACGLGKLNLDLAKAEIPSQATVASIDVIPQLQQLSCCLDLCRPAFKSH
jgi:hypothetical protein